MKVRKARDCMDFWLTLDDVSTYPPASMMYKPRSELLVARMPCMLCHGRNASVAAEILGTSPGTEVQQCTMEDTTPPEPHSTKPDSSLKAYYSLLRDNENMRNLWLGEVRNLSYACKGSLVLAVHKHPQAYVS